MPAVSVAQQRLMGQAYAVANGDMSIDDVNPDYREEVQRLVDTMTIDQLRDFAKTPHKDLVYKKESKEVNEYSLGSYYTGSFFWFTQAGQAGVQKVAMTADKKDPLIQTFIDYIEKEKEEKKTEKKAKEIKEGDFGTAMAASPSNVPGMGNAAPPSQGQLGSGDVFGSNSEEEEEERGKVGIMSYEQYKKWLKQWQAKHQKHPAKD